MRRDSRLSIALHALIHMAEADGRLTSEHLALGMETHPVVMRRTMAGLRKAGIVRSEKGHGGGWTLTRPLNQITLADVYKALGIATLFVVGNRTESPGCLVEQAVNRAMSDAFLEAESVLIERLQSLKLSDVAADVKKRFATHRKRTSVRSSHEGSKAKCTT